MSANLSKKGSKVFSDDEMSAMKAAIRESKTAARRGKAASAADGLADLRAAIEGMADSDRAMAERIHALVMGAAPDLEPKTWYGMPAYARDGGLVCHFQPASKFKTRYATIGFSDKANLDEGGLWPVAYAVAEVTPAVEAKISALVKQAVS